MNIPWPPVIALLVVPLLIGLPVELARHWDYLDARITHHSHREPGETENRTD